MKKEAIKEYDETILSLCPHCLSSTHTIIDENKVGDFCGKCGEDKSLTPILKTKIIK